MDQRNERKTFFSQWLEKLQQESWQLELIISGFALYGVYNAKGLLVDLQLWKANHHVPDIFNFFEGLPETGWKIFFINLLIHVILRALWIGSIGLRYVSSEIDYENLRYGPYFTDYLRRKVGDYDDFIERLEKICSVLFSYTFLLFLMALSFSLIVTFCFLPFILTSPEDFSNQTTATMLLGFWVIVYWVIGAIVFFDFATGGRLKRIKDRSFSKFYFVIYQFYSIISLSIFYRPLLYNFLDSKYTRRLFYFSFLYIFLINKSDRLFSVVDSKYNPISHEELTDGKLITPSWYQDQFNARLAMLDTDDRKRHILNSRVPLRLSSYYIENGMGTIFLRLSNKYSDRVLDRHLKIEPIYEEGARLFWQDKEVESPRHDFVMDSMDNLMTRVVETRTTLRKQRRDAKDDKALVAQLDLKMDSLKDIRLEVIDKKEKWKSQSTKNRSAEILDAYKSIFQISVDSMNISDDMHCLYYSDEVTMDRGLLCHFDVSNLSPGHHHLTVEKAVNAVKGSGELIKRTYVVPFVR